VIVTLPLTDPRTEGAKETEIVHLAVAASLPPHGLPPLPAALKSEDAVNDTIFTLAAPLLVTVTVRGALVVPISWFPKARLAGLKVKGDPRPPVPLPERIASCAGNIEPVTATEPLIEPFCDGENVIDNVQLDAPARLAPQG
jgi:hypothetical protein